MSPPDLASVRAAYARAAMRWAEAAGLPTARVEAAFATVPRERYLPPPPWRIFAPGGETRSTADPARLYDDVLVVLDGPKGINNGQPSLHAAWMCAVAPAPGERVVQIGVGTGYYTAILAALVGPGGGVDGFEIEPRLASLAAAALSDDPSVRVRPESAVGTALPASDVVYVAAGAAAPDPGWLRCLRPGGRLVMPWAPMPGEGRTLRVTRRPGGFAARLHGPVSFIPCVGAGPADRPASGIPARPVGETRSVHLAAERAPDGSSTALCGPVWFSADPV